MMKRTWKTGLVFCVEKGLDLNKKDWTEKDFSKIGISSIVTCSKCKMSLSVIGCLVDEDNKTYCLKCSGFID